MKKNEKILPRDALNDCKAHKRVRDASAGAKEVSTMKKTRKLFSLLSFFCFLLFLTAAGQTGQPTGTEEDAPIKVTFENSSRFPVQVHILSYDMINGSQTVEPGSRLELDVAFGHSVRLEYQPPPHQTTLSQMGSLNERFRTVYLTNDGEHLFIREKFSGQRIKGKGRKRTKQSFISTPENQPQGPTNSIKAQPGTSDPDIKKTTRKEDPTRPEDKTRKDIEKKSGKKKTKEKH
jgi:hypothetical protein